MRDPRCQQVAAAVVDVAVGLGLSGPLEHAHHQTSPRMARMLADRIAVACRDRLAPLLDALCLDVGTRAFGDVDLVVQALPCVRVNPPRCPALAVPFHTDAWAGNPAHQRAIWIPIVDVVAGEGLWISSDDDARRCFAVASGRPARLHDAQARMAAVAVPVIVQVGEAIVFDADVGHGSVAHDVDRTRWSLDLRVAPATGIVSTGWRARPLRPTGVDAVADLDGKRRVCAP